MAAQAFTAAQDSSAFAVHHWSFSAFAVITGQLSFGYKSDFGYSFGYSFGYKIFLEQLCFPIDLAVSALL